MATQQSCDGADFYLTVRYTSVGLFSVSQTSHAESLAVGSGAAGRRLDSVEQFHADGKILLGRTAECFVIGRVGYPLSDRLILLRAPNTMH